MLFIDMKLTSYIKGGGQDWKVYENRVLKNAVI